VHDTFLDLDKACKEQSGSSFKKQNVVNYFKTQRP